MEKILCREIKKEDNMCNYWRIKYSLLDSKGSQLLIMKGSEERMKKKVEEIKKLGGSNIKIEEE